MPPNNLKSRFPREYTSWRNAKQRCKSNNYVLHPSFEKFDEFLEVMGPKPSDQHTLDRIDPSKPEYSPENCRWADKQQQSANRHNTKKLEYEGRELTLTEVARLTKQKPDTLRRRLERGYSNDETVHGRVQPRRKEVERRAAEAAEYKRQLEFYEANNPWRWMGTEEQQKWWRRRYYLYTRRIHEDESLSEPWSESEPERFVLMYASRCLEALRTDDWSCFNRDNIADVLRGMSEERRLKTTARLLALATQAFQRVAAKEYKTDKRVVVPEWVGDAPTRGPHCPAPWLQPATTENINTLRIVHGAFLRAECPLPPAFQKVVDNNPFTFFPFGRHPRQGAPEDSRVEQEDVQPRENSTLNRPPALKGLQLGARVNAAYTWVSNHFRKKE